MAQCSTALEYLLFLILMQRTAGRGLRRHRHQLSSVRCVVVVVVVVGVVVANVIDVVVSLFCFCFVFVFGVVCLFLWLLFYQGQDTHLISCMQIGIL
jgi:hypothetical protein